MRTRLLIAASALLVILGVTALVIAEPHHEAPHHREADRARATTVDARLVEHLGIFRGARDADETADLSAEVRRLFTTTVAVGTGANLELARRADTEAGAVYIVPGRNGTVCQIGGAGMACGSTAQLGKDPRAYVLFAHSRALPKGMLAVAGVATDDVTAIDAVQPDGAVLPIQIVRNAYAKVIPTSTVQIAYYAARGVLRTDVPRAPN